MQSTESLFQQWKQAERELAEATRLAFVGLRESKDWSLPPQQLAELKELRRRANDLLQAFLEQNRVWARAATFHGNSVP